MSDYRLTPLAVFKWIALLLATSALFSQQLLASWTDRDGVVCIEIEGVPPEGKWAEVNDSSPNKPENHASDYSGRSYYWWNNNKKKTIIGFNESEAMTYTIRIEEAGNYQFLAKGLIGYGNHPEEHNDAWVKMSGEPISGEYKIPSESPVKFYLSHFGWTYHSATKDADQQPIRQYFSEGDHSVTIAGRSSDFAIDRFLLIHERRWGELLANGEGWDNNPTWGRNEITLNAITDEVIDPWRNYPPVVDLGPDLLVPDNQPTVELNPLVVDDGLPDGILTYSWTQVSGPAASIDDPNAKDTRIALSMPGSDNFGERYTFRLTVSDGASSSFDEIEIIRESYLGPIVYAVNCGGSAYTTQSGVTYEADNYFTSGSIHSKTIPIAGTADDELFYTERYTKAPATVDYSFPVDDGDYQIRLMWSENTGSGRLMDVSLEGQLVIDALDVAHSAGANRKAYEHILDVSVIDGFLDLSIASDTAASDRFPNIMAIEIRKSGIINREILDVFLGADVELSPRSTSTYLDARIIYGRLNERPLFYIWTRETGPEVKILSPDSKSTLVELSGPGTYIFSLYVSDGDMYSTGSLQVVVADDSGPVAIDPANTPRVDEIVITGQELNKGISLSVVAPAGGAVHMEQSPDLDGKWVIVPEMLYAEVEEGERVTMINDAADDQCFYRIVFTPGL